MNSQLLYQQDVSILQFDAEVVEIVALPDGRRSAILDRTYFYPTGGGQEHDTGTLGSARVVEVYKDEHHSHLVHVVEGELDLGPIKATIDSERRLRHMQHHTAQHLLTQCLLRQTGFETVSANINGYSPSTLDIVATLVSKPDLDEAEQMANQIIYEDRLVKTYFVSPDELKSIPLRRPPKVTENIRIVEINAFDYSPCGGTHVLQTGSIGLVKIIKTERQNERLRIHFVAGLQALQLFQQMYNELTGLANKMSLSWQDLPEVVTKHVDQLGELQNEIQTLRQAGVRYEVRDLAARAEQHGTVKLVRAGFENRPMPELRMLGDELKKMPGLVTYLSSYDGQKVSLIVACGDGTGQDARKLLTSQLASIGGRGGGDSRLAQGGGNITAEQYRLFLQQISLT